MIVSTQVVIFLGKKVAENKCKSNYRQVLYYFKELFINIVNMEVKCNQSTVVKKKKWSIEKFLAEFDLSEKDGNLNYANFHSICVTLFYPHEIKQDEWRIREIFCLFDLNKDGILQQQEWKT